MKTGDTFTHRHWLDVHNRPLKCRITKIAKGTVYYRPINGGKAMYCDMTELAKYIRPEQGDTK